MSANGAAPTSEASGVDVTSWLLFSAVLVNQAGRVMVPAVKTSVISDPDFGASFGASVGTMLSGVSMVCLVGKLLGAAVTDMLGGWLVLVIVFVMWIVATTGAVFSPTVDFFGAMWLLNSFAYTVTWGAATQVVGACYSDKERPAQLSKIASASRFGATLGNIFFGQLLSVGLDWRTTLLPMLPMQALLLLMCLYKWASAPKAAAVEASVAKSNNGKRDAGAEEGLSPLAAMVTIDFWLMLIPKAVLFTYTQFFMNYIPQLLHVSYGYSHGAAASLGGIAQGGSVIGLLVVGNMIYKQLAPTQKVMLVAFLLAICAATSAVIAFGPAMVPPSLVVPLTVLWGLAYALPFYIPPGEFAMQIGGKTSTAFFTNVFDAAGFSVSAAWNPWASSLVKGGDFSVVLLSQALFGAISFVCMPVAMSRQNSKKTKQA
mmetsp:Transcript_46683/g.77237  ORF Transcript_46683/g.77237 Transcript_46683/m.77237 type:complete len:430 (-) Transcript_46683:330-1619(-)|eukprot:CAMPEP_0119307656 /NCGR_PEP_ID=MMETSP1333-20130426/8089_1 /TAXON_ID=418940 /ORGANISM="Scyphosphaera apsteinii, Strain RCC1455" /LENGTH=429 /DNA_ID=CAMNT_0007311247 /DNA_START=30 /DNA_END=1319 /DNA_ORIENTATION=+